MTIGFQDTMMDLPFTDEKIEIAQASQVGGLHGRWVVLGRVCGSNRAHDGGQDDGVEHCAGTFHRNGPFPIVREIVAR